MQRLLTPRMHCRLLSLCPSLSFSGWVRKQEDDIRFLLTTESSSLSEEPAAQMSHPHPAAAAPPMSTTFFTLVHSSMNLNAPVSMVTEVTDHLKSASVMERLLHFPRVKTVSLQVHAATPSSAPVQRLFSVEGLVLTPKGNRLCDERFQQLLLLHFNKYFSDMESLCRASGKGQGWMCPTLWLRIIHHDTLLCLQFVKALSSWFVLVKVTKK